jgi:hypothetical protein
MRLTVQLHVASLANPTINVNGLGAKAIIRSNMSAPPEGLLRQYSVHTLVYNGVSFQLSGEGGEYGTAVASDVLAGKTLGTDAGLVTGTIPHYKGHTEAAYVEPNPGGTRLFMMPYIGYYDAGFNNTWVYRDDSNFIASNIRKGSSIFGLAGTLQPYDWIEPGEYELLRVNQTPVSQMGTTYWPVGTNVYINVKGVYRVSFTLHQNLSSTIWGQLRWSADQGFGQFGQEFQLPEGAATRTFTQDVMIDPSGYSNFGVRVALRGVSSSYNVYTSDLVFKASVKPFIATTPI